MAEEYTRRQFACLGYRQGSPGKLFLELQEMTAEGVFIGETRWYEKNAKTRAFQCGGTYSVEATDKSIRPGTRTYRGLYPDGAKRTEWQALSDAAETADKMRRLEKDETREDILKAMEPLRRAYSKTDHYGRLAMEALVLRALRTPIARQT